jgi:hypothetical protein
MTSRLVRRLRRQLPHLYEALIFAVLVAAAVAAWMAPADAGEEPEPQCGNIQSSVTVMAR